MVSWVSAAVLAACAVGLALVYTRLTAVPPLPELADTWWSRKPRPARGKEDTAIRAFAVTTPPEMMKDLRARLEAAEARLSPPLEGAAFTYGFDNERLKPVLHHWRTKYDWPAALKRFNRHPQFKTNIQGLDIHFIHVKPKVSKEHQVAPLLLLHGWPGSVLEFHKAIELLTKPRPGHKLVFEVICPSLPGYGFSEAAARPGLGATEMAALMRQLMLRLGHQRFFVQGGDWGSLITSNMGTLYPENVEGIHLNMPVAQTPVSILVTLVGTVFPSVVGSTYWQERLYPLGNFYSHLMRESGYFHIQATKPDTVGVALNDSPAGLAAYILEKFSSWTNMANVNKPDGGLTERIPLDTLLDDVMLYWISGSITSSMRLYAETMSQRTRDMQMERIPCRVPTGAAYAPHEPFPSPPRVLELSGKYPDLIDVRELKEGGHFLAMEAPEALVDHMFVTFQKIRQRAEDRKREEAAKQAEKQKST